LHCLLDARARSAVLNVPMRAPVHAGLVGASTGSTSEVQRRRNDPSDRSLKTEQ